MHKVTKSDLGLNLVSLPEEQRIFMEKMSDILVDIVNKAIDGNASAEEVEAKFKSVNDRIANFDAEKFQEIIKDNQDLMEQVKSLSETLEKLKSKGVNVSSYAGALADDIDNMLNSEKYKSFAAGTTKDARGFSVKAMSMTSNYQGNLLITEQDQTPVTQIRDKKLHVRDIATVHPGDSNMLNIAWPVIYEMDRNARYVAENGTLPESSFKMKEEYVPVKRLGTHFRVSRRAMTCRAYLLSVIMKEIVEAILNAEDFGLMFGDGSGDMIKGITAYDGCKAVESIISDTLVAGAAGSLTDIVKFGNGALITLSAPNDLIMEGLRITITSTVASSKLTGTYDVIKYNDTQLYIENTQLDNTAITAEKAAISGATYAVKNGAWKSVESPNSVDALETAIAVMTYAQWAPTMIALNPITLNSIRTEKATDGNRLRLVEGFNGGTRIGGIPVIASAGVPAGKYFLGDFKNGAQIIEFDGGLRLDWAEDVNTKLQNQVVVMAQEELLFPVRCPWAFAYGTISALKSAIAKGA